MNASSHHNAAADGPDIPGFRVLREIGMGGMSTIWLAEQPELRRQVAIKVMLPEALTDEVSRRRFENEMRTLAKLEHPGIVSIHQVGRTGEGLPWYAMPYLPHGHLAQRDYRDDEAGARKVLDALLEALAFAHERGVVHRDIKAENVLFNDADRPLLADFGIALRRGYGPRVTGVGLAVGSTAYMAPEQARGQQVDRRADLYSIGVLAWEMLNGTLPYSAGDALSMALMHVQQPIPRLPRHLRHWQKFIDTAMAKLPQERYQDAAQMRDALAAIRLPERNQRPRPATTTATAAPRSALRRYLPAAVAACLTLGAALWWLWPTTGDAPDTAATAVATMPDGRMTATSPASDEVMLRPLPQVPGEIVVGNAQRQLAEGRLDAPTGDNALESLLAAALSDTPHPDIPRIAGQAHAAMLERLIRAIDADDTAQAQAKLPALGSFARLAGPAAAPTQTTRHKRLAERLAARIDVAAERHDRSLARQWVDIGTAAGLPPAQLRGLQQKVSRIVEAGDHLPGEFGGSRLVKAGNRLVGIPARAVSRADYATFAEASNRPPALCRERGSPLRVLAPRNWQSPGFNQNAAAPVVCVSWQDATAYAQWLSHHSGRNYRLPSRTEAGNLPAIGGERAVALWLHDCGADCNQRQANGRSWRQPADGRALDAGRGYDDIGFLLVRDP